MQSSLPGATHRIPLLSGMTGRHPLVGARRRQSVAAPATHHRPKTLSLYQRCFRYIRRLLYPKKVVCLDEFETWAPRYRPQRINALCRSTQFTKSELKLIYQGFKQVCPSGVANENTFKEVFCSYFPQGDATSYAHYVFKACDQQNSGSLNFQEFVCGLSVLTRGPLEERLRWAFRLYDSDGDGRMHREDVRRMTRAVYQMLGRCTRPAVEPHTADAHADHVFERLDQNHDGYVTLDEFLEACKKDENIMGSLQLLDTVL